MGTWSGEVSTEWAAGDAYGSFYVGSKEKGNYYKPPLSLVSAWYPKLLGWESE